MFLAVFVATGFTFDVEDNLDVEGFLDAEGRAAALLAAGFWVVASTREADFLAIAVLVGLADLGVAADLDDTLAEAEGRAVAVRVDDFLSDLVVELGIARFSGCQDRLNSENGSANESGDKSGNAGGGENARKIACKIG
ncbi:MAG: hypothetical protein MSG64_07245 [Pyrinomonadaceae bacterium MAG19_C2-C3]|nr:hypothetical protein [Pyrinomonadaceae bacterium MAG19_C2-C3]